MSDSFKESIKEGLRVVVLAIIPILVSGFQQAEGFDWRLVIVTGVIAFLRFVDSWLHETNKEQPKKEQNEGLLGEKGLVGF